MQASSLLTTLDQTLIEVQAAHNANDETDKVKKRRKGCRRAKEPPLDESPTERARIEHKAKPNEIQGRQDEEYQHRGLQLLSRSKPALKMALATINENGTNNDAQSKAKELASTKGCISCLYVRGTDNIRQGRPSRALDRCLTAWP
jgi:hypothetical protein